MTSEESVLEVVEGQRENLTNEDHDIRAKAINTINRCLNKNTLNVREVAVLTEFYRERLKDVWQIHGAVMEGMLALVKQPKYPGSALMRLIPTLEQELHVQSLSSKDRVTCCEFFCEIISRHSSWLGQAGEQFTSILISSYDGETDPRVLMNNFGLVSLVQTKGLPGKSKLLWDEMLDICACYFPVDFEPDEKDKVTRSDLVNALNGALLAGIKSEHSIGRRAHSKTLIELVIEKCNSESTQAIDDSIDLMNEMLPYIDYEIFEVDDTLTELIQSLVIKIGKRQGDETGQNKVLDGLEVLAKNIKRFKPSMGQAGLDFIFELTSEFITPPFKPALWPTIKIFASWSKSGCDSLGKCLPSLLPALGHPASTGEALDAIVTLANAGSGTGSSNETLERCLLEAIMNLEVPVQTKLITITAVAACAKADLVGRAALRNIGLEVFKLATITDSDEISREAAHCLTFIGHKDEEFIKEEILPNFTDCFLKNERYVLLLSQFITMKGMIGFEICQKLIYMIRDNQIESEWHPSVYAALDGIAGVVGGIEDNDIGAAIAELVIKDLLQSMVTGVLICCPEHESRTTPLGENDGVNLMSKIVRILAPKMTEDTAEDLRQTMWKMFTGCVISKGQGTSKTWFKPFDSGYQYAREQQKCLPFMTTFFCTRTPISKPTNWNEYTEYYCRVIHNETATQEQRKSATKMLAAVINKNKDELIDNQIWRCINNVTKTQSERNLMLTVWVTKAILMKGGKNLEEWVDRLLSLATSSSRDLGRTAADSWWILLGDTPDLSEASLATVKMLYPQRLFNLALGKIKKTVDENSKKEWTKENMLIILGHLLSLVPSEVQSRELPPLLPLLFQALDTEDNGLVDSSLSTILQLKSSPSEAIESTLANHVEELVDRFTRIIFKKLSLRTRVRAFEGIRLVTGFKKIDHVLVRMRDSVLLKLKKSLDDPKRVIRKEAALAWNVWSMVGQP